MTDQPADLLRERVENEAPTVPAYTRAERQTSETVIETFDRLLGDALGAMNHAVLIAAIEDSPRAMEFIADWLDGSDAIDDETEALVAAALAGRMFPPDLKPRGT